MVFSRLVVSSLFLITVVIVPVTVPESPSKRPAARAAVRISETPSRGPAFRGENEPVALVPVENIWLARLDDEDSSVRRAAIYEAMELHGRLPAEAAPVLARHLAQDDLAREAMMHIGAPAAEALEEDLESDQPRVRAVAAYLLARLAPMTWSSRILPVACSALSTNDCTGDAAFGVKAILSMGAPVEESVRGLLASKDDQAVACALIILARMGTLSPENLAQASPSLTRLAIRWPYEGDDLDVVTEAFTALGGLGERMIRGMSCDPRPNAFSHAFSLWKACADPNREGWIPRGRRSWLMKIE